MPAGVPYLLTPKGLKKLCSSYIPHAQKGTNLNCRRQTNVSLQMITFSGFTFSSFAIATDSDAKASLISNRSTCSRVQPALSIWENNTNRTLLSFRSSLAPEKAFHKMRIGWFWSYHFKKVEGGQFFIASVDRILEDNRFQCQTSQYNEL